jgi:hypothetical protein
MWVSCNKKLILSKKVNYVSEINNTSDSYKKKKLKINEKNIESTKMNLLNSIKYKKKTLIK